MIPTGFKPLLASPTPDNLADVKFPVLASPKLDGIRAIMFGGVAYSRKLKPIPNVWIQNCLNTLPDGLDGELIVGPDRGPDVFKRSTSGVMSRDGRPDFTFHIFDWLGAEFDYPFPQEANEGWNRTGFLARRYAIGEAFHGEQREGLPVQDVPHTIVHNVAALLALEAKYVGLGYEGVMLRSPHGAYKFGRSTAKEGTLLKLKRFNDAEATIIGFTERMHNANEATKDALGHTKRSQAKDGKVPMGTLGALVCEFNGVQFEIGTGFTDAEREMIWNERPGYLGGLTKFKYQELSADKVPRFPVWIGFRDGSDT